MVPKAFAVAALAALAGAAAPLPELRVEAADGGSIFYVRNVWTQPLTAYLIELVNYPGSSYSLWTDDPAAPVAPGTEKRIRVANMTVGAAPEYVKMQAAIYADGGTAGIPEKATQLAERRRFVLETTRELIRRLDKAQSAGTEKNTVAAELRQWSDSLPPAGKVNRNSQPAINQAAGRALIGDTAASLSAKSLAEAIAALRASESILAAAKP